MNVAALQYLILAMNKEQTLFQFEFYRLYSATPLLELLGSERTMGRAQAKALMPEFAIQARAYIDLSNSQFGLLEEPPGRFVIISQCCFDDHFYSARRAGVSVLALGDWRRAMAPPSFVEFVQALLVREAVAALCPSLSGSVHLGTKGCLQDFTEDLGDARQKVLRGYVCHHCRTLMTNDGQPTLADTVTHLLDRDWLGQPTNPRSPAGVMANLRYDLFTIRGRKETVTELFRTTLRQEGIKQVATTTVTLMIAALLFFLGLKTGGH
jgi:hypothetical protein